MAVLHILGEDVVVTGADEALELCDTFLGNRDLAILSGGSFQRVISGEDVHADPDVRKLDDDGE